MPTYSYRCANCDFAFDQYQAFTDDSLTVCPECGQSQLRKVFNSIGVSFTGTGFYRNDSRAGTPPSESSPAPSADSSASKTETASSKPETKPAKSPEKKKGAVSSSSPSGSAGS